MLTATLILTVLIPPPAAAQVPQVDYPVYFPTNAHGEDWVELKAYHVARRMAAPGFIPGVVSTSNRDVALLMTESSFEDRDYLESYRWSTEFLSLFPGDGRRPDALYIKGLSGFQIRLLDESLGAFTDLIDNHPGHDRTGEARFWRAMAKVDMGDPDGAEADLAAMMADPAAAGSRHNALLGWALSLERRGNYDRASAYLDTLLNERPAGDLAVEAGLRAASIALRKKNTGRAAAFLGEMRPGASREPSQPYHVEEYLLLDGETAFQQGRYVDAAASFERLAGMDAGELSTTAELSLAWSLIRQGKLDEARVRLDTLATRDDSIGIAALYQSGIVALITHRTADAEQIFDTLLVRSPYDRYAERSYFRLGMLQYRSGRYRDAKRNFSYGARLFPESPRRAESYRMMGEAGMGIADFSAAQFGFSRVRKHGGTGELLAASTLHEGVALYHLGRFRSSAELLGTFIETHRGDGRIPDALGWRAEALYQDGKFAEAERAFLSAGSSFPPGPKRAGAAYGAAWSAFEQKKFSAAAGSFGKFVKEYPDDPRTIEAELRMADCYFFMGDYDRSTAIYASLSAGDRKAANADYAAFQLAMSYIQRGESERGIEHLRNFGSTYPESPLNEVARFNIAWTYFSKEDYRNALTEFRSVRGSYPETQLMPRIYFNTADAHYNLKEYDSARVYYQKVLNEYPSSPLVADAMTGLQYTYQAEGRPSGAVAEIDKFLASSGQAGSREELIFRKAEILFGQGEYGQAALEYEALLKLNPGRNLRARTLYQLGRVYELENNRQKSLLYYEEILSDYDDTEIAPSVRLQTGVSYISGKKYGSAVEVLTPYDKKYPSSPQVAEARYQLGVALMNMPETGKAKSQFGLVIEKHPGDIFADRSRLQLARMQQTAKQYAAEALLMIGENYLSQKKPADALQAFKDVYEQYDEFPVLVERARLGAGESYERLRDKKQAAALYEAILAGPIDPEVKKNAEAGLKRARE